MVGVSANVIGYQHDIVLSGEAINTRWFVSNSFDLEFSSI